MAMEVPPLTLIYDDGCVVCRAIAQSIRKRDGARRIALVPASRSEEVLGSRGVVPVAGPAQVLLLGPDGSVRRGVAVVQPVLAQLAFWRRIAPLVKVWPLHYVIAAGWLLLQQLRHRH